MCGFAGIWRPGLAQAEQLHLRVAGMADVLAYRGPDDAGFWLDAQADLAMSHRRLAMFISAKPDYILRLRENVSLVMAI